MFFKRFISIGLVSIAASALMYMPGAADPAEVPVPAPTNAAETRKSGVSTTAEVSLPHANPDSAYIAARLEACLGQVAKALKVEPDTDIMIDGSSENRMLLGWLASGKTERVSSSAHSASVRLTNMSWHVYEIEKREARSSGRADLDNDRVEERFYIGPDSTLRIYHGKDEICRTEPLGSFSSHAANVGGEMRHHIVYTEVASIENVRLSGKNAVFTANLKVSESIYGQAAHELVKQVKVTAPVAMSPREPVILLNEPGALARSLEKVPLSGTVKAQGGILSAFISLNEQDLWHSPIQFSADSLDLDFSMNLKPGRNSLSVEVSDKEGRTSSLHREIVAPAGKQGKGRAVIVGECCGLPAVRTFIGDTAAGTAREALIGRGYIVKTLRGPDATYDNFVKAMENLVMDCRTGDRVVLYFAGPSSVKNGSRMLRIGDKMVSADNLAEWFGRMPAVRSLVFIDSCSGDPGAWQADASFADHFAAPSNMVFMAEDGSETSRAEDWAKLIAETKDPYKSAEMLHAAESGALGAKAPFFRKF